MTLGYSTDQGRSFRRLDLSAVGDAVYATTIPAAEVREGEIRYYLESEDSIGQIVRLPKASAAAPYFVAGVSADRTPPAVAHAAPAAADPGMPLEIKAKVEDPSAIAAVRLYYRPTRQNYEYSIVTMTPRGGEYRATIPGSAVTREFDIMYYLEAVDVHGNGAFFPNPDTAQPYIIVKVAR